MCPGTVDLGTLARAACWRVTCSQVAVPKVIYTANEANRGFISAMLAPVDSRREPRFGLRQTLLAMALTLGTMALMRLLLAS